LSSSHKVVPLSWDSQIHFLVLPLASVLNFFCVSVCQVEGYLSLENVCLVKSSEVHHQFTAKLIFMDVHVWIHDKFDEISVTDLIDASKVYLFSKLRHTLIMSNSFSIQTCTKWSLCWLYWIVTVITGRREPQKSDMERREQHLTDRRAVWSCNFSLYGLIGIRKLIYF
jgi:hypothetical protein